MAGDHWAGVGVLVAAKEGAWLLKPTRAPEKVTLAICLCILVLICTPALGYVGISFL